MIHADYELLSITTDDGEKYAFMDKEKMFKFLRETIKEQIRVIRLNHGMDSSGKYCGIEKPYIFKGITK